MDEEGASSSGLCYKDPYDGTSRESMYKNRGIEFVLLFLFIPLIIMSEWSSCFYLLVKVNFLCLEANTFFFRSMKLL